MKILFSYFTLAIFTLSLLANCGGGGNSEKKQAWGTGDYGKSSGLNLDVDAVQKAFQEAKGPEDFEKRINEIYTGKEILSIFVENSSKDKQNVTIYIDNQPQDGQMQTEEKVITLSRTFNEGSKEVQYNRTGYGPYGYYSTTSPLTYMVTGALVSYWLMSRPFYSTPITRHSTIRQQRSSYRQTPAYKKQVQNTRSFNNKFNKNAPSQYKNAKSSFSTGGRGSGWGSKSQSKGSWGSGSKKANSGRGSSGYKSKSYGGSKSRGFGGRRSRRR